MTIHKYPLLVANVRHCGTMERMCISRILDAATALCGGENVPLWDRQLIRDFIEAAYVDLESPVASFVISRADD